MKTFYLKRIVDSTGTSGTGVVAEGVIFDSGTCCMTWNSHIPTVTVFKNIKHVEALHGHDGNTIVVIEGRKSQVDLFTQCKEALHTARLAVKHKVTRR